MKKIHTIITSVLIATGIVGLVGTTAMAAEDLQCSVLPQSICGSAKEDTGGNVENSAIWKFLLLIVNIMVAGVGILAIGGIVYGAVLYTSAGPNQEQIKKAKGVFVNVVIGVLAFAAMWGLLTWLIPGGAF